jgi:hypothetical protein
VNVLVIPLRPTPARSAVDYAADAAFTAYTAAGSKSFDTASRRVVATWGRKLLTLIVRQDTSIGMDHRRNAVRAVQRKASR